MTCVHDAWWRTDRLWLALLVGFLTLVACAQSYRAGERAERQHESLERANEKLEAQTAGWNACMGQF